MSNHLFSNTATADEIATILKEKVGGLLPHNKHQPEDDEFCGGMLFFVRGWTKFLVYMRDKQGFELSNSNLNKLLDLENIVLACQLLPRTNDLDWLVDYLKQMTAIKLQAKQIALPINSVETHNKIVYPLRKILQLV